MVVLNLFSSLLVGAAWVGLVMLLDTHRREKNSQVILVRFFLLGFLSLIPTVILYLLSYAFWGGFLMAGWLYAFIDEMFITADQNIVPSVQMETRVSGRLDADRLAAALRAAVAKHPLARARLGHASLTARTPGARWASRSFTRTCLTARSRPSYAEARPRIFAMSRPPRPRWTRRAHRAEPRS